LLGGDVYLYGMSEERVVSTAGLALAISQNIIINCGYGICSYGGHYDLEYSDGWDRIRFEEPHEFSTKIMDAGIMINLSRGIALGANFERELGDLPNIGEVLELFSIRTKLEIKM